MKSSTIFFLTVLLFILTLGLFIGLYKQSQEKQTQQDINNLTEKINAVNGTLYYREACEYCILQEKSINLTLLKNKINVGYTPDNGSWKPQYINIWWLKGSPTWTYYNNEGKLIIKVGAMDTQELKQFFNIK